MSLVRPLALAVAGLTVSTIGVGVVGIDAAHAGTADSVKASIKVNSTKTKLTGKLTSKDPTCKKAIKVKLHWLAPGAKSYQKVATDVSGTKGTWAIHAPSKKIPAGKYFVTTDKTGGCFASKSRTITV